MYLKASHKRTDKVMTQGEGLKIHLYIYLHAYTRTHTHTNTNINIYLHASTYTHSHTHTHTHYTGRVKTHGEVEKPKVESKIDPDAPHEYECTQ